MLADLTHKHPRRRENSAAGMCFDTIHKLAYAKIAKSMDIPSTVVYNYSNRFDTPSIDLHTLSTL